MHFAIFGVGGIGGYLAGKLGILLQKSGSRVNNLSLITRGVHLKTIREHGFIFVDTEGRENRIDPAAVSDDFKTVARASPVDVVFLCVKGYDLDEAVGAIKSCIGGNTFVIPLLNGADIYERVRNGLEKRLPEPDKNGTGGIVLPGAIYISAEITGPGQVHHKGGSGLVILGKGRGQDAVKPDSLLVVFEKAGIPCEWHEDPFPAIWTKFLFIAPLSIVTAVTGKTFGELLADATLKSDVRSMMEEVEGVARARGVKLPPDAVESTMQKLKSFPPETKTSFQRDVEASKPKDERDIFGGTVIRLGRELGIDTPVTEEYFNRL